MIPSRIEGRAQVDDAQAGIVVGRITGIGNGNATARIARRGNDQDSRFICGIDRPAEAVSHKRSSRADRAKAQVDDAIEAGAKFIVSPGLNPEIVKYCQEKGCPIVPGINNPTGIEQALSLGLDTVKFFPAEQSGGLNMIKAMSAPYGAVKFMPTGGVSPQNVCDYLAFSKIFCCGGSWMVKPDMIAAGDFEGITKLVRQAVDTMLGFKFKHVGINTINEEAAANDTKTLQDAFSFPAKVGSTTFVTDELEIMHSIGRGTKGHIGIKTNSVERAIYHLERRGVEFDYSTARRDKNGDITFIYLADEIGGFAYHLCM
jgi:2-dehydro-3-deoxyphosphogluconate aldolase/(4S)-4-hydroxy-2-oxoglutarate aldolase